MRVKEYPVLLECVRDGVTLGWNRAHKSDPEPPDDRIMEEVVQSILLNIMERFDLEDGPDDET